MLQISNVARLFQLARLLWTFILYTISIKKWIKNVAVISWFVINSVFIIISSSSSKENLLSSVNNAHIWKLRAYFNRDQVNVNQHIYVLLT